MLIDYHTHLENGPYSLEWLQRFVDQAKAAAVAEIGITEHGHRFVAAQGIVDNDIVRDWGGQDVDAYVALIEAAKQAGFPVKLGLEMDYVPGKEKEIAAFLAAYPWDYVIGSVHWDGDFGLDLPMHQTEWARRGVDNVYRRYFELVRAAAASGLFDVMGHADLVKIYGYRPSAGFDLEAEYAATAAAFAAAGVAVEVSTAGLRRPVGEIYPAAAFLRACRRQNVPITLASDAHRPEDVGFAFDAAVAWARSAGYDALVTFAHRRPTRVPLG